MSATRMVQMTVTVEEELAEGLSLLARVLGSSRSAVVREVLRGHLARVGKDGDLSRLVSALENGTVGEVVEEESLAADPIPVEESEASTPKRGRGKKAVEPASAAEVVAEEDDPAVETASAAGSEAWREIPGISQDLLHDPLDDGFDPAVHCPAVFSRDLPFALMPGENGCELCGWEPERHRPPGVGLLAAPAGGLALAELAAQIAREGK